MQRSLSIDLTTFVLAALVTGNALIAQDDAARRRDAEKKQASTAPPPLVKASDVLGTKVKTSPSQEASDVGELEDLVVDAGNGSALFGIVSTGGFLGLGETHTAVPCSVLAWRQVEDDSILVLETTKEKVAAAPAFTTDKTEQHLRSEAWRKETEAAFGAFPDFKEPKALDASHKETAGGDTPAYPFRLVSELDSAELWATDGKIGALDDLVFDRQAGRVLYALIDDRAIPWSALKLRPNGLHVGKTKAEFEAAPKMDKDAITRLGNPELVKRIDQYYTAGSR